VRRAGPHTDSSFRGFLRRRGRLPAEIIGDAQFLLDIGEAAGTRPGRLFLGTELHYQRSQPCQLVPQTVQKSTF
jgi:hypothetical protein